MTERIHLVQLQNNKGRRAVAIVANDTLKLISTYSSIYELVMESLTSKQKLSEILGSCQTVETIDYLAVWQGTHSWRLLPSFDHPTNQHLCMVTGTGLTHRASAENRDKMNSAKAAGTQTDSMKMYQLGEEAGNPPANQIGVQAEWFYKGNGSVLKAHNEPLLVPDYGLDGGEEPEIAGVYVVDNEGCPVRVGFTAGNEFSDHVMERINYLYLAPSKIRSCSIGPELVINADFGDISGNVQVKRGNEVLWKKDIATGQANMAHSLQNLEYHHFKYQNHRLPGQVHIHYFGTGAFSFGVGLVLEQNDTMHVHWPMLGKALVNPIHIATKPANMVVVKNLL
jgi:hypothetical protein